jgi:hypothetical protein
MYTCRDATEAMTDAEEQKLVGSRKVWFNVHMTICYFCRSYRRQLREAVSLAKEIPREEAPSEVVDHAMAAFRARRS